MRTSFLKRLSKTGRIGAEAILTLAVLLGGSALVWKFYSSYVETERQTLLAEKKAQEAADRHIQENADLAIAQMRRQNEEFKVKQAQDAREEAMRQTIAQREADALLARRDRDKAAADKMKADEAAKSESQRTASADQKAKDLVAQQQRAFNERAEKRRADLTVRLTAALNAIQKLELTLAACAEERVKLQKQAVTFRNITAGAKSKVEAFKTALATFDGSNSNQPERPLVERRLQLADDEYTRESDRLHETEDKLKDKVDELAKWTAQIKTEKEALATFPATPAEIAEIRNSIVLEAAPAQPTADAPAALAAAKPAASTSSKAAGRVIHTHDGKTISAQALMILADEISYKDDTGAWQTIPKADVKSVD
jgi:hypothetical protein